MSVEFDKIYREKTDSAVGFEDWEFDGGKNTLPNGEPIYAMRSDRGIYWFTEKEISEMQVIK